MELNLCSKGKTMSKYDDLNSCLLEGRLVKDPSLIKFENDKKVCNFTIAVNSNYKLKDGTYKQDVSYIEIQSWNGSATLCDKYLHKGCLVRLRGSLKQKRWEDKEGNKNSRIVINAEHVEFRENSKSNSDKKPVISDKEYDIESNIDIKDLPVF